MEEHKVREARLRAHLKMRSPSNMGIICIDVTNKCDLACSNCTRLLANQDRHWDMSPDNFRLALRSLKDFTGTIAMIGGNPCMHPKFAQLCQIFVEEMPNKAQRGLWTNNVFKHAALAKETFGVFNLNPHNVERGIASLDSLKNLGWYYEGHSEHAPLLAAVQDLFDPVDMWDRISRCDINQNWSASIIQIKGEIRAYFCEVAASFDLARKEDHGLPVVPGWWRRPISEFFGQIDHFCPGCGVPGRLKGHMDHEETDGYTKSNAAIAEKAAARKKRKIVLLDSNTALHQDGKPTTLYSPNIRQQQAAPEASPPPPTPHGMTTPKEDGPEADRMEPPSPTSAPPHIFVVTPYYQESLEVLRRCHDSVLTQQQVGARITHIMVADGYPRDEIDLWNVEHVRLPREHGDNGNTPRAIGSVLARAENADFIAWLDADNWFYPEHLASMLDGHRQSKAIVLCSWREFYTPEGEKLNITEWDEANLTHVDTSCFLVHRAAFDLIDIWSNMPRQLSPVCDRIFFAGIKHRKVFHAFTQRKTVGFTTVYAEHFVATGRAPPENAKSNVGVQEKAYLNSFDGVRDIVSRLGYWPG